MPNWKKLIVSGSDAVLRSVTATNGATITGSFRVTGSSNLIGNQTITGSILVTQSYISKVDYIEFTSASDQPTAVGRLGWNDSDGTLSLGLKGGNLDLLIGEAEVAYVFNAEATTLTKGTVVYISGSQGNRIAVKRASNSAEGGSAGTLGFVAEPITSGGTGFIITSGVLKKVDTSAYTAGQLVYLSSSAGQFTPIKPVAPQHEVRLGYIERVSATVGSIYVKVDNGYEIGELHDVLDTTTTSSFGDLLVKSGSLWITSKQLTGSYGLTGSLQATSFTGSLQGTSSWAVSASQAITASYVAPAGSNFQIQYNNNGTLGATGSFRFNYNSQSLAQGFNVTASGVYSHAEGSGSSAIGIYSHAEGRSAQAVGEGSHAEGRSTQTIGEYSHAEGNTTQAIGIYSHAEGGSTQAIGNYSHAEGVGTQAIGIYSHAEGNSSLTGTVSAFNASATAGIVDINGGYGDVSSNFSVNSYIILYDTFTGGGGVYGKIIRQVSQSYFDTSTVPGKTVVELYDTTITTTPVYIYTTAGGGDQTIPGDYSHAEGESTQAIGNYSHAEGVGTQAIGEGSHAEGKNTQAIGDYSHAEGDSAQAIGGASHAEGESTQAIGNYSHAEGSSTQAIGDYSHAEGRSTQTIGDYSHAEGDATQATGFGSHAEGYDVRSSGSYSHAEGETTIASGFASHAEGLTTLALGDYSHAEGGGSVAQGLYSHAEGESTQAIGYASHAEGFGTLASGSHSHAEGLGTVTSGSYQHAQGQYNLSSSAQSAFIIGNGVDTNNRSNLVFASGSQFQITGSLQVTGSAFVLGLTNTSQTNVLTYNSTTGQVFFTASSAIGGGGGSTVKAGSGSIASFGGSPLTSSITFGSAFSNNSYAVTVTGEDARSWTIQSKTSAGFTINSNSSVGLTGPVYWMATPFGS